MSRRNTGPDADTVKKVLERDNHCCVKCGHPIFGDRGVDWSLQHRVPRGMGGTRAAWINEPANLILLHGSATTGCHQEVESNRAAAMAYGYLVSRHADPAEMPVLVTTSPGGDVPEIEWRLLDNSGSWVRYEHEEVGSDEAAA